MSIVILANNHDFFKKYGKDKNCINFINSVDIFVRFRYVSEGLFGDRRDHLVIRTGYFVQDMINKSLNYKKILYSNPSIGVDEKYPKYNDRIITFNIVEKIYDRLDDLTKSKYDMCCISDNLSNKYKHLFTKTTMLTGLKIVLYLLEKYPNHKIYLLGFLYSNSFCNNDGSYKRISQCHDLGINDYVLKDIIENNENVILKNNF